MAKIKIAQTPTFKAKVGIPRVGGKPEEVEFTFIYKDRLELAAMYEKWNAARAACAEKFTDGGVSLQEATTAEIVMQVEQVKDIVSGWAFEDKFSDEAITALVTTCVGAPRSLIDAYEQAYNPARLGN